MTSIVFFYVSDKGPRPLVIINTAIIQSLYFLLRQLPKFIIFTFFNIQIHLIILTRLNLLASEYLF